MVNMENKINSYQAVVVFDPNLTDEAVQSEIAKINTTCTKENGGVKKSDIWGRRRLAYRINKKEFGIYSVLELEGGSPLVSILDRQLKINDAVMRHLIVVKDEYAPDFTERLVESELPFGAVDGDGVDDAFGDDADALGGDL